MLPLPKHAICVFLIVLVASFLLTCQANAQTNDLKLEAKQQWDTYLVGGTCIPGGHNLFASDIDNDGVVEIVTGGIMYEANSSFDAGYAPLKIWSWNGKTVFREGALNWEGGIWCVYASDLNGDGTVEIITAGSAKNQTGQVTTALKIFHFKNQELSFVTEYEGISINSLTVADLNGDGRGELITVGGYRIDSVTSAQLCTWRYENESLLLTNRFVLENVKEANSVVASDLDKDGIMEIVTAGYAGNLTNSKGALCVWHLEGQDLVLKSSEQWQNLEGYGLTISGSVQGNTVVNSVKSSDVDGDGAGEIVTGGFSYDGSNVTAQVRIWRWNKEGLKLMANQEWASNYLTEVKCVFLDDVDDDSTAEIITSGVVCAEGSFSNNATISETAQLRVWDLHGDKLSVKHSKEWVTDEGVCAWNVATADLLNDGVKEIISVGCSYLSNLCDPDMRIWSVPTVTNEPDTSSSVLFWGVVFVFALVTVLGVLLFIGRRAINQTQWGSRVFGKSII